MSRPKEARPEVPVPIFKWPKGECTFCKAKTATMRWCGDGGRYVCSTCNRTIGPWPEKTMRAADIAAGRPVLPEKRRCRR